MTCRIASWNINSIRLRQAAVLRFLREYQVDILAVQETKTPDDKFPSAEFAAAGYPHQVIHGMKSYNGLAIVSRHPLTLGENPFPDFCQRQDCRHAVVQFGEASRPIELHNLYIPAGGDIADPEINPKFAHKLDYLAKGRDWFAAQTPVRKILLGDLNIAPLEQDVWSHRQLLTVVSHTPIEVEGLEQLRHSLAWVDAVRRFYPPDQKLYSWWSYRNQDWEKSDRGRRLDHIWVTPDLVDSVVAAGIAKPVRGWETPSDHVPVWIDLDHF
ncbi:MAG: exodeoxyribonuclease III [Candidatus Symbiobacter sp.]|nr:exodeoxyribonuclease III [Candidatus Symbiobacter sp.]